jgi:hypothetical protein
MEVRFTLLALKFLYCLFTLLPFTADQMAKVLVIVISCYEYTRRHFNSLLYIHISVGSAWSLDMILIHGSSEFDPCSELCADFYAHRLRPCKAIPVTGREGP